MSEEKKEVTVKGSPLTVSAFDFVRFLEDKTLDSSCPACKLDEWTIICPYDDEADAYRLITPLRDGKKPTQISTFAIFCDNCGYVRQHMSRVVRSWANENPVEPELDFDQETLSGAAPADE